MKAANTNPANSKYPTATVTAIIKAPIGQAFNYIAPIYLPRIFPGTRLIPGVAGTSTDEGWTKAGLSRTVYFTDGTTSQETMLTWNNPTSFSYKNEHFTSPVLSATSTRIEGEWHFTSLNENTTRIEWTYRAIPRNLFARIFLHLVLMRFMKGMLQQAMDISKQDLETGNLVGAHFASPATHFEKI
jgi:hypothetical protein